MENKVPTPNFSSENSEVQYFKYTPVSKWDFESFKKHMMEKRLKPNLAVIYTKYKHCLRMLTRFSDLSKDKMQIVNGLIENCETLLRQEQPQRQRSPETNYYNYGTVGFQSEMNGGTVSVIPSKGVLEETEEGHVKIPKPDQSCHLSTEVLHLIL